ncbi:MAG: hypothetical protein HLUCCO02_05785 [Idiomarinaceae bacterium HL-53]|nr:MAG: hypothetical protein HLUCCO02_05785 [Idiomarinaceae bacterium HL-53]CUS48064.1 Uncaracterized surface protein containing fasciclin (FAS1) repeats [Idiomarinaceae bacterium HL-53]
MKTLNKLALVTVITTSLFAAGSVFAGHHSGGEEKEQSGYEMTEKTIANIAASDGNFQTLVAALQAADLVDTLNGEGEFTVFAPTDEAFAALPEGTVEDLLKPENRDQLISILTYHVVSGEVMSSDIANQELSAETLQGSNIDINATNGGVMINNATVTAADIDASNGVIHVIDTVLIPSE